MHDLLLLHRVINRSCVTLRWSWVACCTCVVAMLRDALREWTRVDGRVVQWFLKAPCHRPMLRQ